jgi:hypothetical protein
MFLLGGLDAEERREERLTRLERFLCLQTGLGMCAIALVVLILVSFISWS